MIYTANLSQVSAWGQWHGPGAGSWQRSTVGALVVFKDASHAQTCARMVGISREL
jgi:hypothetical protein